MNEPAPDRSRTLRRPGARRFFVVLGVLFGAMAVVPLLPLAAGTTGDVRYSYMSKVPRQNRGTYLVTDRGALQLFAWNLPLARFPDDAAVLAAASVREVAVVQKALSEPSSYVLVDFDHRRPVPWGAVRSDQGRGAEGSLLTLRPARPLDTGRYLLVVPNDSSFGGVTENYFALR